MLRLFIVTTTCRFVILWWVISILFFFLRIHLVALLVIGHFEFFFSLIFIFFLLDISHHLVEQLRKENEFDFILIFIIHGDFSNFDHISNVIFHLVLIINYHFEKDVISHLLVTLSWFINSWHHIFVKVCKDILEPMQII